MNHSRRKWSLAGLLVALCLVLSSVSALAQDETAAAGNGGTAECAANGGAVAAGDVNSGANLGAAIGVGDSWGDVEVDGGALANRTDLGVGADGGTGICDASGGEDNIAFTLDPVAPAPEPGPDPLPPVPPLPPEPIEPFQVCVTTIGAVITCGPGACTGPSADSSCTVEDCSTIPGDFPSPCNFGGCTVVGNVGNCTAPQPV